MANETKVLTLGEIGMLPNKFLSKSYIEEDTFYEIVDASRFYYDYCYRPFETFNVSEIIMSANDYEFNGTISEFESKINAYKDKGYEIAIINLNFFNKVYYPNLNNTIISDSNSKSYRDSLNYIDMEKIWYVNLYYENWNGIITWDELQTFNPYFLPGSLIIYDIQNDTVFPWPLSRYDYEAIITDPTIWTENGTKENVDYINRLIKRYIWACKSTSVVDKNFCPAVNDEISFSDWDLLSSVGTKRIIREHDTGFRGILSDTIPLETTSNTKCVLSGELGQYNSIRIVRGPKSYTSMFYDDLNEDDKEKIQDFVYTTQINIKNNDGSIVAVLKENHESNSEWPMYDYSYDYLINENNIENFDLSYTLTFNFFHYDDLPIYIDNIYCSVHWDYYDNNTGILPYYQEFIESYDQTNPGRIIIKGNFSIGKEKKEWLFSPHFFEFNIEPETNDYVWFCGAYDTIHPKLNYHIEDGYIPNENSFFVFNNIKSNESLPSINVAATKWVASVSTDYLCYGISVSELEGRILAVNFIDGGYFTDGIALFDFTQLTPKRGDIYYIGTDADGFVLSNDLILDNFVDSTAKKFITIGYLTEEYNSNEKYYAVLGLNSYYDFPEGQNSPFDWETGDYQSLDLRTNISCGDNFSYKNWTWNGGDYGEWDFSMLTNNGKVLDCKKSYHEQKAQITVGYRE